MTTALVVGILSLVSPFILGMLKAWEAHQASGQRGRDAIDKALAGRNPTGVAQLLDRLFERARDKNSAR